MSPRSISNESQKKPLEVRNPSNSSYVEGGNAGESQVFSMWNCHGQGKAQAKHLYGIF